MVHSEDLEAHARSIGEDLEYWRTKRLEPRVFRLLRKDKLSFYELLQGADKSRASPRFARSKPGGTLEDRIAALEVRLGDFIRGIEVATSVIGGLVLVEESRDEAGVYTEELKLEHRRLSGPLAERVSQLEKQLDEELFLLDALLVALTEKDLISVEKLDETLAARNPPRYENGARIVAKAWLDPGFRSRLMNDAKGTLRDLGFALNRTPKLVVVEDTESLRNVIVCTLCSCYPYELLGNPPWWYKHDEYKQTIAANPRKTLAEMFKLKISDEMEIRVHDSTSDIRYMVLPKRPDGTGGLTEEELAGLVTEESLIGVGETLKPSVTEMKK